MAETIAIAAEVRDGAGKGVARAARRNGRVPGVIYGDKQAPVTITVELRALNRLLRMPGFMTNMYEIEVGGGRQRVLTRAVQYHPVTDVPIHIDFLRVGAETRITVGVPVQFINEGESPGLKRGGVLNVVRYEVELVCRADQIPDHLTVDLAGTDIGDSIHISAVTLPEGVRPVIADRDFTIATVASPSGLKPEGEAGAAAAPAAGTGR